MRGFTSPSLLALSILLSLPVTANAAEPEGSSIAGWNRTVEEAKQEGQVNIYIEGWGAVLESGVFQKRYPEINVVVVSGRGGEVSKRILAERRAGKYIADVSSAGPSTNYLILHQARVLDPIKPALILPEVIDEKKWWGGKHLYADPERQYVFRYVATPGRAGAFYNTVLVQPDEIKSVWDFLQPKWKSRIEVRDVRDPGPGRAPLRFFYYHPEIGPKFISRLFAEMDITLFRDFRQATDWLATGRFHVCFFCSGIEKVRAQGLPVNEFPPMKEGARLHSQYGTLSILNKAPHPNAAKVFINWFLSREGQMVLQKTLAQAEDEAPDSLRIDIPKEEVRPDRRMEGVKYIDLDAPGLSDMKPILKIVDEALARASKK